MKLETGRSFPLELESLVTAAHAHLTVSRVVERLWAHDYRLWKEDPTDIVNRLGWLTIAEDMKGRVKELQTFASSVKNSGIRDVVLLGMGGSSLGPEVLRASFGSSRGFPRLQVLDSTIPSRVRQVTQAIDPARSLFILASKSGETIEVLSLFAYFWALVHKTTGHQGGQQFIAITDPDTELEKLAVAHEFRRIFTSPVDIGGRYSVLSYFGLVPAALMGVDVARLLARATKMARVCHVQAPLRRNLGVDLGSRLATLAQAGRNKVTFIISPQITAFALWAEQLLAESTGKEGRGLIPVTNEPIVSPVHYGRDRFFVYLRLKNDQNKTLDQQISKLTRQGHPVLTLPLQDRYDLAREFFRWEVATAVAAHLLGIHPFNQPNVEASKRNTARMLNTAQPRSWLTKQVAVSTQQAATQLRRHGGPGAYVAILAYTTLSLKMELAIRSLRRVLISHHQVTTTAGYGPRYLHSTGQLHKGGPSGGLFLQFIDQMSPDLGIPKATVSFGTLARAQAAGDILALHTHDRQAITMLLGKTPIATIQALTNLLMPRLSARRSAISRTKRRNT